MPTDGELLEGALGLEVVDLEARGVDDIDSSHCSDRGCGPKLVSSSWRSTPSRERMSASAARPVFSDRAEHLDGLPASGR